MDTNMEEDVTSAPAPAPQDVDQGEDDMGERAAGGPPNPTVYVNNINGGCNSLGLPPSMWT
jgi:hypothetical protein